MKYCLIFAIALFVPMSFFGQEYLSRMMLLLQNEKYSEAFNFGKQKIFDLKAEKKRNLYIEYLTWLSLSLNQNTKTKQYGCTILSDYLAINKNFFQENGTLKILETKKDSVCLFQKAISFTNLLQSNTKTLAQNIRYKEGAILDAHFKTFHLLKDASTSFSQKTFFSKLTEEDFKRITSFYTHKELKEINPKDSLDTSPVKFSVNEPDSVVSGFIKKTYYTSKFYRSKNFVIISRSKTIPGLKISADELEKVLNFYCTNLHYPKNENLIFIYLSKDYRDVAYDVRLIYKDFYTSSILGYTDIRTNSIVAWIPSDKLVGTLKHELIHILSFNLFNFTPNWFEEGLASLYEESRFSDGSILNGINNWRLRFLKALKPELRDSLFESMVTGSESKYEYVRSKVSGDFQALVEASKNENSYWHLKDDVREVSYFFADDYLRFCKDAMGRYVLLYIQNLGKLKKFMLKINSNNFITLEKLEYTSFLEIFLAETNSKNTGEAYNKFNTWLTKQ